MAFVTLLVLYVGFYKFINMRRATAITIKRNHSMNDSNSLNGGQVIIDYLIREKVPYLFAFAGMAILG